MELTAARRHRAKGSPREVSWAPLNSLSSSTTSSETCLMKSYMPTIWSCGAQRNTLQLQTIDCSSCWISWKVGQNGDLSNPTPGRSPTPSSAFQQRGRRPTCISKVRLCLLRTTPPTWVSLSTGGWHGEEKTKLVSLLAYFHRLQAEAEALKTAAAHIEVSTHASHVLSSLQMPCPSCRPFSHIGTPSTTTYWLLLPPSAEAMQSPCSGFPPTATCLAMRLLTLCQRRARQKSKWIGPPATLR